MNWNEYFIKMAELASTKSKDPSTKVGAVIVGEDNEHLSSGFNGFPRGVQEVRDPLADLSLNDRWQRPKKYAYVEHAERNAIYNAARAGIRLKGATMYLNWSPCPCTDCARAVIQAGIVRVVGPDRPFAGKGDWEESLNVAREMLNEAGVEMVTVPVDGPDHSDGPWAEGWEERTGECEDEIERARRLT